MTKKREELTDQLRRAVDTSGSSRYRICKEVGLAEATMSRFMNRTGGLSMQMLDRLGDYLELEIVSKRKAGE